MHGSCSAVPFYVVLCTAVHCCNISCCASCRHSTGCRLYDWDAQVGQILFHGRISKSNRMLPFTTQIIEVVAAHYPPNLPTPNEAASAVADAIARPTDAVPVRDPESGQAQRGGDSNSQVAQQTAFPGLQVSLRLVEGVHGKPTTHKKACSLLCYSTISSRL